MGEPLKKNKLHHITIKKKGEEVKHYRTDVDIEDLKSALEEFQNLVNDPKMYDEWFSDINSEYNFATFCLRKAFPAIYGDKE